MTHKKFVRERTTISSPSLVPELRFHSAGDATDLWEATEKILGNIEQPPPYWAFCWPGGQAAARFLLDNPYWVDNRRVLDFGAGSGIGGIAAYLSGAREVIACDKDPLALAAVELNAELNFAQVRTTQEDLLGQVGKWDVVLLGDLWYERELAKKLIPWINELHKAGIRVLLSDPHRTYFPTSGLRLLENIVVPTTRFLEDSTRRDTGLYVPDGEVRLDL